MTRGHYGAQRLSGRGHYGKARQAVVGAGGTGVLIGAAKHRHSRSHDDGETGDYDWRHVLAIGGAGLAIFAAGIIIIKVRGRR